MPRQRDLLTKTFCRYFIYTCFRTEFRWTSLTFDVLLVVFGCDPVHLPSHLRLPTVKLKRSGASIGGLGCIRGQHRQLRYIGRSIRKIRYFFNFFLLNFHRIFLLFHEIAPQNHEAFILGHTYDLFHIFDRILWSQLLKAVSFVFYTGSNFLANSLNFKFYMRCRTTASQNLKFFGIEQYQTFLILFNFYTDLIV